MFFMYLKNKRNFAEAFVGQLISKHRKPKQREPMRYLNKLVELLADSMWPPTDKLERFALIEAVNCSINCNFSGLRGRTEANK